MERRSHWGQPPPSWWESEAQLKGSCGSALESSRRHSRRPPASGSPRNPRGSTACPREPAGTVRSRNGPLPRQLAAPLWGPHTHGRTRVSRGRPQAWAYASSWSMGRVLRASARPLPGRSTAGRGRGAGVRGWQPPPAPAAAGPSLPAGWRKGQGLGRGGGGTRAAPSVRWPSGPGRQACSHRGSSKHGQLSTSACDGFPPRASAACRCPPGGCWPPPPTPHLQLSHTPS